MKSSNLTHLTVVVHSLQTARTMDNFQSLQLFILILLFGERSYVWINWNHAVSVVANGSFNQVPSPPTRNHLSLLKLRRVPIFQFRKPNQATSKTQTSSNSTKTDQDSSRVRANNRSARKLPKFPGCIVS